jgi:hypothetical protein
MDIEFLDPGPNQPYEPVEPGISEQPRRATPEAIGLLIMLSAAALLPVVAAFQAVYSVRSSADALEFRYTVDGWGRYTAGEVGVFPSGLHEPRFGILLCAVAACFAVLALLAVTRLVLPHPAGPPVSASSVAGAAAALTGVLVGITGAMTLQIETVFDRLRSTGGPIVVDRTVHLGIGGAVWLTLAAVLAGGLSVAAALRVRRAAGPDPRPSWRQARQER